MEECRGKEEEEENDRGGNGRDEFPEVIFAAEGFKFRHDRGVVCISYDASKLYTWRVSILLYSPVQFPPALYSYRCRDQGCGGSSERGKDRGLWTVHTRTSLSFICPSSSCPDNPHRDRTVRLFLHPADLANWTFNRWKKNERSVPHIPISHNRLQDINGLIFTSPSPRTLPAICVFGMPRRTHKKSRNGCLECKRRHAPKFRLQPPHRMIYLSSAMRGCLFARIAPSLSENAITGAA